MAKKKVFQISNALVEGLEETINAAHNYSGELRVDVIPIKKIDLDPDNPRDLTIIMQDVLYGVPDNDPWQNKKLDEIEDLKTLAHSIREQGLINPIVVYKFGEKYRLVAGERRTLASLIAGKTDIQAKILDTKPTELKISLLQWIENVERSDLSLWERLRNLEKIVNLYLLKKSTTLPQLTSTEISNLIGCSKPHAINYRAVLLASEELKEQIRTNKIRNLEKAALIANTPSKLIQHEMISACVLGSSLKKLRSIAERENQKRKLEKITAHVERRGRAANTIHLGMTRNVKVARVVLEALLQIRTMMQPNADKNVEVNWSDMKSINQAFRQMVKQLEQIHV
jgi:ParB family chromosome partitioning protein